MKRVMITALVAIMALGVVLSGCGQQAPSPAPKPATTPAPAAQAEPVKLKVVSFHPPSGTSTKHFMVYFNEVNKRGAGKVVLEYLGGPEVVARDNQPMAANKGSVDMVYIPFTFYGGMVPIGHAMQLTAITAQEEIKNGTWDYVRELHAKAGLYWVGRAHDSMEEDFRWNTTKKISSLADFKGRKAGSGSIVAKPVVEALGAAYVQVQAGDVFTALERGVIDSYVVPPNAQTSAGAHKACKYILDHGFYRGNVQIFMGLNKWNEIPKDAQNILQNTLTEMLPQLGKSWDALNAADIDVMVKAGEELVKLPPADAEVFVKTAYIEAGKDILKQYPETAPKLLQLMNPKLYNEVKDAVKK